MTEELSKKGRQSIMLMLLGTFIASLTQTVMTPALPSIMRDLHIDAAQGQWLTTIFMLVNGIMIPCTAYLMARFKTRSLYLVSMSIFFVGTLIAGFSNSFMVLLFARVLQALCFGILMPLLSGTILMLVPPSKRGTAMGMVGLIVGVAPAIGPSLAGFVIDTLGWHAFFFILAPFIFLVIALSFFIMGKGGNPHPIHLDFASVLLSTLGFGGLLYGFSAVGSYGWTSAHILVALLVGFVGTAIFMHRQTKLAVPLLRLDAFKNKKFTTGTITMMILNAALIFGVVLMPIYLQDLHGYSAFTAALVMLPSGLASLLLAPLAGILFDKLGARKVILFGEVILVLGSACFCFITDTTPMWVLVIAYTMRIGGCHIAMTPANTWAMSDFMGGDIPHANALCNTLRQVASSIGTAVFVSIYVMASAAFPGTTLEASISGMRFTFSVALAALGATLVLGYFKIDKPQKNK